MNPKKTKKPISRRQLRNILRKKRKDQKKKVKKPLRYDKMSFEDREKHRAMVKEQIVYTKSFRSRQSFGAASGVRIIDPNEYEIDEP